MKNCIINIQYFQRMMSKYQEFQYSSWAAIGLAGKERTIYLLDEGKMLLSHLKVF